MNIRTHLTAGTIVTLLAGCTYDISGVPVNNLEPGCVRECSASHSECIAQGEQIGVQASSLRACQETYMTCTSTCPAMATDPAEASESDSPELPSLDSP